MTAFVIKSILLGIGLAADAFTVSVANGLSDSSMKKTKAIGMASVFAFFQCAMPLIGWAFVSFAASKLALFSRFVPLISLVLLIFIGGKMLIDGIRNRRCRHSDGADADNVDGNAESDNVKLTFGMLILQGIATSIDALSVGFTIAQYSPLMALLAGIIIGIVTFIICIFGISLGKHIAMKVTGIAAIAGGVILIGIGIEIFISSLV